MKFKIELVVEGGESLEKALQRGHFQSGIDRDVLDDEETLESFTFEKIEE
jgi:hypothetical protein